MSSFVSDIRYGFRQLRGHYTWSVVAVLTLALGIGVSTAVLSVIDAAILRPLPYPDPERLVRIIVEGFGPDGERRPVGTTSMEDVRRWGAEEDVFSHVAGWGQAFRGRVVQGPEPERVDVLQVTEDYLPMHGVLPLLGRGFDGNDMEAASPAVAILGFGYWQARYGGRSDVVGETVLLEDGAATIVGVLPASFGPDTQIMRPLRVPIEEYSRRGTGRVSAYGRLQPGVSVDRASEILSARMVQDDPEARLVVSVSSRLESAVNQYQTTVTVLVGAAALILLIACVNVAGLLLGRGAARRSELGIRAALGARSSRLARQLLTESLVLCAVGSLVGVFLAWTALDLIVATLPLSLSADAQPEINGRVLLAAAALLVPTVLIFGIVPAIRLSSSVRIAETLAYGGRQRGSSALSRRGGQWLIATEVALAVVLAMGAGLMLRTSMRLGQVDLGFEPEGLVTMEVLPLTGDPVSQRTYYPALIEQIRLLPGVTSAGAIDNFPLGGVTRVTFIESQQVSVFETLPGYFETMGVDLVAGRLPTAREYSQGRRIALVNETAAGTLFPEGPAVGRELSLIGDSEPFDIVGVVADVRHGGPLSRSAPNQAYFPFEPDEFNLTTPLFVVARTSSESRDLAPSLRRAAEVIGPPVLIESIRPASALYGDRVATPRQRTILLSLLGGLGLILALTGVFGMTAYAVTRRTGEIGVRLALGARPYQMVRAMIRDSVIPILIGTLVGVAVSMGATRLIRSFLFETEPTDPATFGLVALTLILAGSVAALGPALRAARIDPASTLRVE